MKNETQVTLTQSELTSILILCTEFIRRDNAIRSTDLPTKHLEVWRRNCNSIILKTDNALTHCIVADED